MTKKANGWKIPSVILLVVITGLSCFRLGKQQETSRYQAEREREVLIAKSDLEGLGEIDGPIYVTGHKSPDTDTVACAIAYAELLQKLGYDARPVVLGEINHETAFVLSAAGVETPELLIDASGKNMILVDHSETASSADGLTDATILSIIDHHNDGSVTTGNTLIYDARPIGATATIVWDRYHRYGVDLNPNTAMVLMGAILSDTTNLKAESTTYADREALKELSVLAGVSDTDAFYQQMYRELISYKGMSDEEIFFNDYKEYEAGGMKYSIGVVNVYDDEEALDMAERMKQVLPSAREAQGADMAFAHISIFHDDQSAAYLVPSDEAAEEVLCEAFGEKAVFDGTSCILKPGISRKKTLVPAITEILERYPKE